MKKMYFALIILFFSSMVFANGGSVQWTGPTLEGVLRADKPVGLILESEDLKLKIIAGSSYEANAKYTIQKNSAQKQKVLFGLPISWPDSPWDEDTEPEYVKKKKKEQDEQLKKTAGSVKIRINSEEFACQLINVKTADFAPAKTETSRKAEHIIRGWCVANVVFPAAAGKYVLELNYTSSLEFDDDMTSKSPYTHFGSRTLYYPLYAADSWAADSFKAKVLLDPGVLAISKSSLPFKESSAGSLEGTFTKKDLPGAITIDFSSRDMAFNEISQWNKKAHRNNRIEMKATASSSIEPQSKYGPEMAIDGNPETAWCFKDKTGHPNAEITLNIADTFSRPHTIFHIIMARGYLKNEKIFNLNGRVKKAQLSTCDGKLSKIGELSQMVFGPKGSYKSAWYVFNPSQTPEYRKAYEKLQAEGRKDYTSLPAGQYDLPFYLDSKCIKVKVLETDPGSAGESCVSEINIMVD